MNPLIPIITQLETVISQTSQFEKTRDELLLVHRDFRKGFLTKEEVDGMVDDVQQQVNDLMDSLRVLEKQLQKMD